MSIDRQRVEAVNLLMEKGYRFADGKWVAPETAIPLVPAQPAPSVSTVSGCSRHGAANLYSHLRYQDPQFASEMDALFDAIFKTGQNAGPLFRTSDRFFNILSDAFIRATT
jgi:hypothetical protein